MACGEFDLIARYFSQFEKLRKDVKLGRGDDCALVTVAENQQLAISTDTLVAGVHFLADIDPADLAYKALAVNLSDLAAMGAEPAWISLAITLPTVDEPWLAAFSESLFKQLFYYNMQLIGGDTTRGPLSITLTIHGLVPQGRGLTRSGARIGDWIYVTGTLGDSAAGLALLQQRLQVASDSVANYFLERHLRPQARILQGLALRELASAAIDISDGLIGDLGHILKASQCGAQIYLDKLPLSIELLESVDAQQALQWALIGGEDYELCFTVPEINRGALELALGQFGVPYTCVGQICAGTEELTFLREGKKVELPWHSFDHFLPNEAL